MTSGRDTVAYRTAMGAIALVFLLLTFIVVAVVSSGTGSGPSEDGGRTLERGSCRDCSVVVIVMDALRPDHLGCYGYPEGTSPNIDAFAASAIRFENMIAVSSWTKASTVSILTGRYPKHHRVDDVGSTLPTDAVTLPRFLSGHGYSTAGLLGNRVFDRDEGFARSFDSVLGARKTARRGADTYRLRPASDAITDDAIRYLDGPGSTKRFVYIHYMDTHQPYFDPGNPTDFTKTNYYYEPSPRSRNLARYDAAIRFNDQQIGRLFAEMKRRGYWETSIIVVTADHGEAFGEHGDDAHYNSLYDEEIRVPFIVMLPGARPGIVRGVYSQVDIMPTLLAALGIPAPEGLDGIDALSGKREHVFSEFRKKKRSLASVRTTERKVIFDERSGRTSCFDLSQDPGEETDVIGTSPDGCRELRNVLDLFLSDRPASSGIPKGKPDLGELQQLRALGYVD